MRETYTRQRYRETDNPQNNKEKEKQDHKQDVGQTEREKMREREERHVQLYETTSIRKNRITQ